MFFGSFIVPLNGWGARYGASVSRSNRSRGTFSQTSLGVFALVKVKGPSNPIYIFSFKTSSNNSTLPE